MSKGIDELKDWAMHNVRLISIFPSNKNLQVDTKLSDVLDKDVDERYFLSEEQTNKLLSDYQFSDTHQGGIMTTRHKITKETDISHSLMARDYKGIGNQEMTAVKIFQPVLTPDRIEKRQNGRRFKEDGEPMFTLTAQDRHGVMMTRHEVIRETDISHCLMARDYKGIGNQEMTAVKEGCRIRKLTPLECWRLQGFTDEQFYKAKNDGVSNSQLYKQAGNSVTVNVIDAIARKLI